MKFKDLEFRKTGYPKPAGIQARALFENGYGASVICNETSYGHEEGLYELAVTDHMRVLIFDTLVTPDVEGDLSEEDVTRLLGEIEALPKIKDTK